MSLCLTILVGVQAPALAAEPDQVPEVEDVEGDEARLEVIQNRKHELLHEVTILAGVLPTDPFYKGITATAGYTLHFNDIFAWEVIQFTYSFNLDAKLKTEIIRAGQGQEDDFPEIEWIAASHLVLKPLYGKEAWFNTEVIHMEVYLQGGAAFLRRANVASSFGFGVDVGFGIRIWMSKWASFRLDIMELIYFPGGQIEQALRLHAGIAFNLRGEE